MEESHAFLLGLLAVVSVAAIEISIGIIGNSIAVISDGIHALFDGLIMATLLIMIKLSLKPRDLEHTYGHGRLETIAGFIGGVILFIISILIIRESIVRIFFEEVIVPNIISIYAVIYAIIIAIFRIVILKITNIHKNKSLKVGFYDALADLGSSTLALIAVILANYGIYAADGIASLVLAGILLFLTSRLTYSILMELSDAIDPRLVNNVRDTILSIDGVRRCKDIRMRRVGKDILTDVVVTLDSNLSFTRAHMLSSEIENAVRKTINGSIVMVHFEPEDNMPMENMIREIAREIEGVKDIHNIMISETPEGRVISMHLQVDGSLSLIEAHEIADRVEDAIKERIDATLTIHIEPLMREVKRMVKIEDDNIQSIVKELSREEGIKSIKRIDIYSSDNIIRFDIYCNVDKFMNIEEAHEIVTRFERRIRERFNAIVNIHTEP